MSHIDDDDQALVLGVLFEEFLSWVRTLPGSQGLAFRRGLRLHPPRPAKPPTSRMQSDADHQCFVDALNVAGAPETSRNIGQVIKRLRPRNFLVRNMHTGGDLTIVQARCAMSMLRGPMTRSELMALKARSGDYEAAFVRKSEGGQASG